MDPTVFAAWIAAGVSVLTLVATLAAQYFDRRGTNKDTEKAFAVQRDQLDRTLAEQARRVVRSGGSQPLSTRKHQALHRPPAVKPQRYLHGFNGVQGTCGQQRDTARHLGQ